MSAEGGNGDMKKNRGILKRIFAACMSVCLLLTSVNLTAFAAESKALTAGKYETVTDPGTAHTFETMLGTDKDGNRYAGRLWVDKSVYKDGDTAVLNTTDDASEAQFEVSLQDDEAFQVIFSVLGSSMTTTTTTSSSGPMDVVLVLDTSGSMTATSGGVTRFQRVIEASNRLIDDLLTAGNVRLGIVSYNADSDTILNLDSYTNGVTLSVNSYGFGGGVISAIDDSNNVLGRDTGMASGTNLQSGIDRGMDMLATATNVSGAQRKPVLIVLTDGAANHAVTSNWYNIAAGTVRNGGDAGTGVTLSTLLNAAYNKARIEDNYGTPATVYGISVDLSSSDPEHAIMNPGSTTNGFNSSNRSSSIRNAYTYYTQWAAGQNVSFSSSGNWTFSQLPANSTVTRDDVIANINYVDNHHDVSSANLDTVFDQIYEELTSGAFNPITDSTTVVGGTGADDAPLIYVDNIGRYMEVKQIQAVTLFGASYGVTKNNDGTYTVQLGTGVNPTTNEAWDTSRDIKVSITEETDGTQKLEIRINQEILPILLDQVVDNTVGDSTTATITELLQRPLRVYYTVGLDSDILLPNGDIDLTKIDKNYLYRDNTTGKVSFYSNEFGVMNTADVDNDGILDYGDAHVGFKPSAVNRYYYHPANQGVYTEVTRKDGGNIQWEEGEYGVLYEEDTYDFTYLTYEDYQTYSAMGNDKEVYTYVTFYRPTESTSDAANAAEKVTYIVYTNWGYLKESIAFYDHNVKKYINYKEDGDTYSVDDTGYAMPEEKIQSILAAYMNANPNADIRAFLGVGSLRTSRFHNMIVEKTELVGGNEVSTNYTGTAEVRYAPEYTHGLADEHNGNDVVVWLGNNGKLTVTVDTGIALTKNVTEAIGNADDPYALTVTIPSNVTATPVVKDVNGNDITSTVSTYLNHVLTVNIKAGETVYISGIPAGTECTISENIPADADYRIASRTEKVTIPTIDEVINGTAAQYVAANVTNTPNKYGNLYITKEIASSHGVPDSVLEQTFEVEVDLGTALAGKTYTVEGANVTSVTVDNNGKIALTIKARQTIEILGLPEGTIATVTENLTNTQDDIFVASYRTRNQSGVAPDSDQNATIVANANATAVITNTYTPKKTAVDLDIAGTKNFKVESNYTAPAGTFNFKVQKRNGADWVDIGGKTASVSYAAGESGTSQFTITDVLAGIEFTETGSWAYQVVEVKGSVPNVTYDRTLYTFTVTVTDNGGQLVATVTDLNNTAITDGSYEVTFENTYHTAPVSIDIVKEVHNESGDPTISKAGFKFNAVQTDANWVALQGSEARTLTVFSDAEGEARVTATYSQAGTYYYVVSEEQGTANGWKYSNAKYRVTVTVTEDNGNLTADMVIVAEGGTTVAGETAEVAGNSGEIRFINAYNPKEDTIDVDALVKKALVGRTLKANEFTFEVRKDGETTAVLRGTNNADGTIDFKDAAGTQTTADDVLTFDKVGNYEYDIVEINNNLAGIAYDGTVYDLVVEVKNNTETGELEATSYFEDATTDVVTFENKYKATPTEYQLGGWKDLKGRAVKAGEFTFELYQGANPAAGATPIERVTNKADGTFTFSKITYDAAGEYIYTIKEYLPADNEKVPGVTYTGVANPITVKVTITDDEQTATLSAAADITNVNIKFENSYQAAPAYMTFDGTKTLKGATLKDGDFTFKLYQTDSAYNIAKSNTILLDTKTNTNGTFTFSNITYTVSGDYFYVIAEDASVNPIANVVYDGTQHRYQVQVRDNGRGQMTATVIPYAGTVSTPTVNAVASVAFTNATFDEVTEKEVYKENNTTTHIDGQKVNEGDVLTYFITYTNYTGKNVTVDIVDTIPEHTSYVDGSASHNGNYAGGVVDWILNVARGESVTVSFDVKVNKTQEIIANTATVRDGINTYYTNEVVNHTVDEIVEKDVFYPTDVNVSIDGRKVYSGDTLLYVVEYRNLNLEGADVTITDDIPKYTTYVEGSADNDGVYKDGTITWKINDVPAWTIVRVAFQVTVDDNIGAETITNKADVTTGLPRFTTNEVTNYTVEDEVKKDVFAVADTKTSIDGKNVKAGDELLYTISYKNCAKEKATVVITDAIPQHTTYVEGSADYSGVYKDGILTWNVDVEAGKTVVVSFKVKVNDDESATITNKAEIKEGKNSYITNEVTSKLVKESETVTPPSTPSAPKTGDTTSTAMWSTLTFASIMVCGALLVIEKKRRNEI